MNTHGFGLGCMSMSLRDEADNAAVIREALESGVTSLNTGDFYTSGESEMVLGNALRGVPRDSYYISVKFGGMMAPGGGMYGLDVRPKGIKNYLTHSLKRLRLDYVDLYQPCRIDEGIPAEDTIGEIADLVKEGYVRQIGISEVDARTLERANAVHPIAYVEMDYSLFNRSIEAELLPAARRLGIGVVTFGILAHGLLSGAWTQERVLRGDVPARMPLGLFSKGNLEKNIVLVENLRSIAAEKHASLSQLMHAWALAKGDDMIPLIGTGKVSHFKDSLAARELSLSAEDITRIEAAVPADQIAGEGMRKMRFQDGEIVR